MMGEVGILNVGAGDTKLTFDKNNPEEMERAAKIVTDMISRGYVLLVEVERAGKKVFQRIKKFKPNTCEYIISEIEDPNASRKRTQLRSIPASDTRAVAVPRTAGG